MYIDRGKEYLDTIVDVIEQELQDNNKNIPVFAQHYLRASDVGKVPYVSVVLDKLERDLTTIGKSLRMVRIYYAITLVEKYQEEKLFTDLPIIEDALEKVEDQLPYTTEGASIIGEDIAYEEVGNIVLQATQITFLVECSI